MSDNVHSISDAVRGAHAAPTLFDGGGDEPFSVLPQDCPVTALGHQNQVMYLLDHANQMIPLKPDCRKGEVMLLFGGEQWLESAWPQWRAPKKELGEEGPQVNGFDQKKVQSRLIQACSDAGIFNPQGMLFGRGAHQRLSDDALVLHIGNRVLIVADVVIGGRRQINIVERKAGLIEGKIYPALKKLPPPSAEASTDEEARRLQALFGRWYFFEPEAAPLLLLGWVGHALICGAFGWRSHVWLTGETAAGKSTLQKLIRSILDEWGLFTEDASEAAVRQLLKDDTLPVMIDEAEADDRADRQTAMINLARKASSGAKMHRGSSDHNAQEFTAQSAFLFSSILHSPLDPQDRNRFAILAMRQVPPDAEEPVLDLKMWREAGRRMHRRMVEQWPRFAATLKSYKDEIRTQGFQGRWRDTFGTLLACADMLLFDGHPDGAPVHDDEAFGRMVAWVRRCLPLMQRGRMEAEDTTTRCIAHLTSSLLPAVGGQHQETVGRWLRRAMEWSDDTNTFHNAARAKLKAHGLRVVNLTKTPRGGVGVSDATTASQVYVLIASKTNVALRALFNGSKWFDGGWSQALALAKWDGEDGGAEPVMSQTGVACRFTGGKEYAVAVPIEAILGGPVSREVE